MYMKQTINRVLSLLLALATLLSLIVVPSMAAVEPSHNKSLGDGSSTVTIQQGTRLTILGKSTGGTFGGNSWSYTSNDGITGPAYCVNYGLKAVSPTKKLQIAGRYDRSPKTMGAFSAGYPQRTLAQFKELNPDIQGIEQLTETEFAYATQIAVWATCGQVAVPGTSFTSGRSSLVKPTSGAQKIRVYESVLAILKIAETWDRPLYTSLYFHMEKDQLGANLDIVNVGGLDGAANSGQDGIKKETINGKEYYTRLMYIDSGTSTYPNDYLVFVYAMDAPAGTIITDSNNQVYPSRQQWGATMFEVPTAIRVTNLNANGSAYMGAFKLCLPCDDTAETGSVKVEAYSVITQFNLYLANNPTASEQSYIIADPAYIGKFAAANIKWSKNETTPDTASLQVQKVDGSAMPLEGAEFTLTGSKGTQKTGISDRNGYIEWTDLPADESFVLTETKAPAGFSIVAPRNITLTAGQTSHVTVQDSTSKRFTIKKIDAQNGSTLQGAVFRFEQIDGTYVTTGTTGFDGILEFAGDELPFGSYRVTEERAPTGYEKDISIQTVKWDGTKDVLLTFKNVRKITVVISKVDGISGVSLPGATFDIYKDGKKIGSATTDDSGEFRFPTESGAGYYEFIETVAPEGYQMDPAPHGMFLDPYDPQTQDDPVLTIKNYNKPGLCIVKLDQKTGDRLPGVTFKIYKDGALFDTATTDEDGEIVYYDLEPGTYMVAEIATDDDHVIDLTPQQIELKAGQQKIVELTFFNGQKPGMRLIKVDSSDPTKVIPGAVFEIKSVDGSFGPKEFTTDENGEIDLSKLPEGSYVVTEKSCAGYVVDDAQRIIELQANQTAEFVFTNTKKPGLRLVKTSADGTPLDGVTFKISPIGDASHSIDRTTANGGEIFVEDLEPGVYSVIETATLPDHILDTTEYHVELIPGKTAELRLSNDKRPYLTIAKVEQGSGTPIPGTKFRIEGINSDYQHDVTTGADGTVTLQVDSGSYRITEKDVPEPYCLPEDEADRVQTVSLNPNDNKMLTFKNNKKPLLTLSKIDADSGVPIPNTVFTVRALDGTYQDDWKTGADGKVALRVAPGVYRVTEKSVPSPYYIPDLDADRTQTITLSAGDDKTLTFRNRKAPELTIFKENSVTGEAIEHAKFHVTYTSNGEAAEAPATIDFGEMFTDARGEIRLHEQGKRLYPGEYTITEVEPADGFQLKEPLTQTIIIHGNESKRVVFQNTPLSALVVWKYDSVTGAPVEGAVFQVKYMSDTSGTGGTVIGTYKTGPGGSFTINRLKAGAYTVEELASDGDHVMDTAPQTAYISGKKQDVVQLCFGNSPKGAVLLKKIDAVTHAPLSDVEFFITDSKGTMLGDANGKFVTDSAGTILISNIDPGTTIVARETRAKENYILDDVPQTVTIQAGRTATLEFRNQPKGSVTLYKFSGADRKTPLEGVGFKITYADGKAVDNIGGKLSSNGVYYTDSEGQINISGVTGTLIFTEISSIPGYLIDENRKSQTIVVNPDDHQSVYFYNQPIGSILVKKMSSTTKEPLSDVVIRITRTDGSVVGNSNGEFRTDENGFVRVDVEPGSYIVQEVKSKPGFLLDDTPKVVEVKGSGVYNIELFNQPLGSLVIHKYSSLDRKTPLAGVQFKVTYAPGCVVDDENGKVSSNGIYYTESDGTITIDGIVGTVVVTEQASIPGYSIDPETRSQTIVVNPDDVQHVYFYNTPKNALIIEKYLETEGADQPLKGVTFQITDSSGAFIGSSNGEYITGDDGRIVITGLEPGTTVNVREIKVPDGVVLDSTVRTIKIGENGVNTLRIVNRRTGYLVIRKLDKISKAPLSGVEFELTYADGRYVDDAYGHLSSKGRFTTNDAGEIRVPVIGTIVVKELTPCPGYVIDQSTQIQTVTVNPADTQTLTVYNEPLCSLTITKLDSVTGKPVPNTEFTLKDGNGNVLERYTTGADGTVTVTGLVPNSTVVVVESKVPSNYVLDPTPHTIIVRNGSNSVTSGVAGNGNVSGGTTIGNGDNNITVENVPKTTLVVEKYVTGTTTPLKGVTFLVTESNGKVLGSANGEFTTDKNGRIVIEGLEPGTTIIVKEIETLEGYILDTTPKSIQIKVGEAQTLRFYNQKQGALVIRKLDSVTKKPLAGVEFQLTYADGSYVDADNSHLSSKGLYTTDKAGEIRITGITGTIVATETKTIDGYSIDETARTQTVKVNAADTQYVTFYNAPIGGLELIKVSEADKTQRIPNVKFEIRRMDGGLVDTITTGDNGRVYLALDAGNYYAVEIEAAKGFKLDNTPHYFTVQNGKTTTLTVTNKPLSGILIHKTDSITGKGIYGVTFLLYDSTNTPIGQYSSDNNGYVRIEGLTNAGYYYLRELKNDGYVVDTELKTIYVKPGETTEVTWQNTPITGQIQIVKSSADYNSMNGWPAGTPIPNTEFEVYNIKTGALVDTIRTDKNGAAASKPLPLGRYKLVESKAADFYGLDKTPIEVEIEFAGQIVKTAMTNKSLYTNVSIQKTGYVEVMPGQQIRYDFSNIANNSTIALSSFYWRDTLPTQAVRLERIVTGTYNVKGNYKIVYKTNLNSEYRTMYDNLSTQQSYDLPASSAALGLASNEYVTEFMVSFGVVPANFRQVEAPKVYCKVQSNVAGGTQFTNQADVGGVYNGQWIMANTRWVTRVYAPAKALPRTGY